MTHDTDPTPPHGTPRPTADDLALAAMRRLNTRRASLALSLHDLAEWVTALADEVANMSAETAAAWLDDLAIDDPFGAVRFDLEHLADADGTTGESFAADDLDSPFGGALDR